MKPRISAYVSLTLACATLVAGGINLGRWEVEHAGVSLVSAILALTIGTVCAGAAHHLFFKYGYLAGVGGVVAKAARHRASVTSADRPVCHNNHGAMIAVGPRAESKGAQVRVYEQEYACPTCDCRAKSISVEGSLE